MREWASSSGLALLCRIGGRFCALPVHAVEETMRPLPIEPLRGMPGFVRGLAILRGSPTPVVDGRVLLGDPAAEDPTRFVTLKVEDRRVALAVDEVVGIRRLAAESLQALPPLLRAGDEQTAAVVAIGSLDAQLLLVLGSARLVPEAVWEAIESRGDAS